MHGTIWRWAISGHHNRFTKDGRHLLWLLLRISSSYFVLFCVNRLLRKKATIGPIMHCTKYFSLHNKSTCFAFLYRWKALLMMQWYSGRPTWNTQLDKRKQRLSLCPIMHCTKAILLITTWIYREKCTQIWIQNVPFFYRNMNGK